MSGFTGLVDTSVADKLAQRPDLVRLPSASVVPGLDPAVQVAAVANDVRLQSDAARARQMFAGTGTPAGVPAGTRPPAPADELSRTARAISALLADLGGPVRPVTGGAPLAPHGATVPAALARGLETALSASGLFYESHLAAFAAGALARADLELEPQGRLPLAGAAPGAARPEAAGGDPQAAGGSSGAPGIVHPQARAIVSQQLDLLATGVFQWRGEAWPNVPLHWRLEEDRSAPRHGEAADAGPGWTTTLSLTMPELGVVDIRLTLRVGTLSLGVAAGEAAAPRLRERTGELQEQLAARGLELPRVAVETRDAP